MAKLYLFEQIKTYILKSQMAKELIDMFSGRNLRLKRECIHPGVGCVLYKTVEARTGLWKYHSWSDDTTPRDRLPIIWRAVTGLERRSCRRA